MKSRPRKFRLLSLYSGAGGLDQGFELTNRFETAMCVENESIFAETLRINQSSGFLEGAKIVQSDVSSAYTSRIASNVFSGIAPDGVVGGPPCQSFSVRGKRLGLRDPRSEETFRFMRWVGKLRPRFFLMENVPRILQLEDGLILDRIVSAAESYNYEVSYAVLCAADFGSATARRRAFIVGWHEGPPFVFPRPTHSAAGSEDGLHEYVSSGSALAGLPSPTYDGPGIPQGHIGVRHTPPVEARFARLRPGQQDDVRKRTRLDASKPSPTLVAGNLEQIRSHIHPTEPRELTNRESARIHSFPDHFTFAGNHAAMGKQIANSVPIPLARALADRISVTLDE